MNTDEQKRDAKGRAAMKPDMFMIVVVGKR